MSLESLSPEDRKRLDPLIDRFEDALAAGEPEAIEPLLAGLDKPLVAPLLEELVHLEIEHREASGGSVSSQEYLSRFPDHAEVVRRCFVERQSAPTLTHNSPPHRSPRRRRSRGLKIRCPHCSNFVELVSDARLDVIDCDICGSSFSLVDRTEETRFAEALEKIDRFELIARVGVGGFGTVWKARDVDLDRTVAVKIPRYGTLSPDEMEQFFREARSVAQLRHPNIVPVHEVGREGDVVFIVSDLIRGVSLSDALTGTRYSAIETAALLVRVAEALEHAHQRGIVHRDLKPSNIMLDDDGVPYLMDFGLAKRAVDEVAMTTDGQIIGTPAYMSPEQATGRSAWADRRTDVYSLGVILFELLTGELPFRGNAQMQVHSRVSGEAPNARTLNRHLPLDLATITAKCLERDQGRRYQTAAEVGAELQRFLNKEPILARPLSIVGRTARWIERRPLHATLAALVAALAVGGPTAALLIEQQRAKAQNLADRNQNLIDTRLAEQSAARDEVIDLRARLDLWEGRANPWEVWPPDSDLSPLQQLSASLLSERAGVLSPPIDATSPETPRQRAERLIALAYLQESLHRDSSAVASLQDAATTLEELRASQPLDKQVGLALADVCRRLAALAGPPDEASRWLQRSTEVLRSLSESGSGSIFGLSQQLEAELRLAAAAGFDEATPHLDEAEALHKQIARLWPQDAAKLYELVCELAGRPAFLAEPAQDQAATEAR